MGNSPDVRVRLSAEGQQEIIKAFQKIQSQAEKTGRVSSRSLSGMTAAASSLGRVLPTLTFGAAIAGATVLIKRSLDSADAFAKLSQKTGVSVELLSGYAHAADLAGLQGDDLAKSLAQLAHNAQLASQGSLQARQAFDALNVKATDSQGRIRPLNDLLLDLSDRFSKMEDGPRKSALAMDIFGRAGVALIPFLNKGPAGLKAMREEARRLGVEISGETAKAAEQLNDDLSRFGNIVEGLVNRQLGPALGLLTSLAEQLLEVSGNVTQVDSVVTKAVVGFLAFGAASRLMLRDLRNLALLGATGGLSYLYKPFRFSSNAELFRKESEAIDQFVADMITQQAKLQQSGGGKPGKPPAVTDETAQAKALAAAQKLADARLALSKAGLDNELAIYKAHDALLTAEQDAAYKQGLVDLEKYYSDRRTMAENEAEKEIAILQAQADELSKRIAEVQARPLAPKEAPAAREAEALKLQQELDKTQTQIVSRGIGLELQLIELDIQHGESAKQLSQDRLAAEAKLLEAEGRRFEAEQASLEAQIEGLKRLAGESDAAYKARQDALRSAGETQIEFEKLQGQAQAAFGELESERIAIDAQVKRGMISQLEGQERIAEAEKERLPVLHQIAEAMRAAAVTPEQIQAAQQLSDALVQLGASSDLAGQRLAQFRASLSSALADDVSNFFTQSITQANSLSDAFRNLAESAVASLQRIVVQMLINYAVQKLLQAVGGSGFSSIGGAAPGVPLAGAEGGLVHGPGGPTSDSIPARLSRGEYVVRAAVVDRPGMLQFLEDLNSFGSLSVRSMPNPQAYARYASGGLVENFAEGRLPNGQRSGAELTLELDDSLILRRLVTSRDWDRAIIHTLQNNSRAVSRIVQGRGGLSYFPSPVSYGGVPGPPQRRKR